MPSEEELLQGLLADYDTAMENPIPGHRPPKVRTCPYCKIDFRQNPWASDERFVCANCRHYFLTETADAL